jgi:hypothetical protein
MAAPGDNRSAEQLGGTSKKARQIAAAWNFRTRRIAPPPEPKPPQTYHTIYPRPRLRTPLLKIFSLTNGLAPPLVPQPRAMVCLPTPQRTRF